MRIVPPLLTTAAAVALCSLALIALDKTAATQSASDATFAIPLSDRIERGRYLVHQVGMCIDCHSPRDEGGEFIESQHLTGAPLAFAPTVSMPWMPAAPRIAGLPVGFTEEQTVDFLSRMPTLLSCTDGSSYARSVYDHTAWAALRLNAAVHVLHILEPHRDVAGMTDFSGAIGVDAQARLTEELVALEEAKARVAQTHARAILADAKQHLTAAGVGLVEVEATHGELIDSIDRSGADADLIVIGKRGEHADLGKLHLGGNLQRVIRSAGRPVLVASRAFQPIEHFLRLGT